MSRRHQQHHRNNVPEETVHMNILGRDSNDVPVGASDGNCQRSTATATTTLSNADDSKQRQLSTGRSKVTAETSSASAGTISNVSNGSTSSPARPSTPVKTLNRRGAYQPPSSPTNGASESSSSSQNQFQQEIPLTPVTSNVSRKLGVGAVKVENHKNNNLRSNWWGRMQVWASKSQAGQDVEDLDYRSLESPYDKDDNLKGTSTVTQASAPMPHPLASSPQGQKPSLPSLQHDTAATVPPPTLTVEDQVRQDCTFFYRGLDENDAATRRSRMLPGRRRLIRPIRSRSSPVFTTRDGAMFHAKYERLNQVLEGCNDDRDDDDEEQLASGLDYDLRLNSSIEGQQQQSDSISFHSHVSQNVMDVQNSSLFYEQNGRLLMRLPRDQIRLVMDAELQAGIVAVEQWRQSDEEEGRKNDDSSASDPKLKKAHGEMTTPKAATSTMAATTMSESSFMENSPPLRYVLTVPDDLYRRIVSEMSDGLTAPTRCCHESEHADIRVAIVILAVILLLLFVSTLYWPTE